MASLVFWSRKSTLIRMFNHLEAPTSGEVIIDGDHIGQLSKNGLRAKRQKVSMIFQHFNLLWSRTVLKILCFRLKLQVSLEGELSKSIRTCRTRRFKR